MLRSAPVLEAGDGRRMVGRGHGTKTKTHWAGHMRLGDALQKMNIKVSIN